MPIVGFGLYFALAIFCAVHVVRTGQPLYWLMILFAFPIVGSLVYFVAVYLPNSRLQRNALKAVSAAAKAIDPQREVRAAQAAFEETPTAQNQMRLAAALLDVGDAPAAARAYEACMAGPFARDPEIRLGAARACVECQRHADALRHLEPLRREQPDFRPEQVALLLARSLAGTSRDAEARAEFAEAESRFGTFEAKAEYAIWAYAIGDRVTSARLQAELDKVAARWSPLTRELNEPSLRRLQAARELAAKTA
ncbi:tetratricopeptide repeat protein [Ramlibacter montanisoli]|uniref:Tetratricopeptide repeat protein n=1 Tax=Ramlibacter montanisoli TaxID=2732512 RepID=A0A849KI54_9BURK|nr:tetratricopeptide repeat protein [Ramlibacter montanisoli]NNU45116.1 tetratricopeptide repeat protein [Ramlibacter montanisoli]